MPRAVIFDFDSVVALTEDAYMGSFDRMMERHGLGIKANRREWLRRFPGTGPAYILETVFREHNFKPKGGIEPWLGRWKREYERAVKERKIRPVRGFLGFNKELKRLGIRKIIATGSHRSNTRLVLESLGLEKEFRIVSTEDIRERKPDPEIFLLAARKMGVPPEECVVFEDSPVGIRAAKRAGMKCVALTTTNPGGVLEREKPDLVVKDYTEINIDDLLG